MQKETILVVDDERLVRWSLQQKLEQWGYHVSLAEDGATALGRIQLDNPDLVTLDVKLPDMTGIDVLSELRNRNVQIPVIVITAFGVVDDAVRSLKLGAYDFIEKPINFEKLENVVRNALETRRLRTEVARTHEIQRNEFSVDRIIGVSDHIRDIRELVKKVAASEASTILIQGESGTGKDLVAHAIHYESSRRERPFFAINCAAIPEALMESELFGHEKGAFTGAIARKIGKFELAHNGTILLDEISEMNTFLQAKILRVLQEGEVDRIGGSRPVAVDIRVIATTNRNLEASIAKGEFREDLYYRLNVIEVHVPPLREREGDVEYLAGYFQKKFAADYNRPVHSISPAAREWLRAQEWRGNVRELKNRLERAVLTSSGNELAVEDFAEKEAEIPRAKTREKISWSFWINGI